MNPHGRIYSAGPSITDKECAYVSDAIQHGWYAHYADYKNRFEQEFARYVGSKYALATSCCTVAMHLALTTLGIGPGDEVIIPEITWVATANVVAQTGATPVIVDVEEQCWTIDPKAIQHALTPRTKAIMPVHSYGHPSDMHAIREIAREHRLTIVEDAAPSVGSEYFGQKTGTLSDIGCFSFQGSKILVTGEGGMLVTNNEALYQRAQKLAAHGREDSVQAFWSSEPGFKYTMANLLAALGLAQLERVDELIANKRRIYDDYARRLSHIDGIAIFKEKSGYLNNCAYPSILLTKRFQVSRDELIAELRKHDIDVRPVFPCLGDFPAFERRFDNPVARSIAPNGLNLPCAHNITSEEIDAVCDAILEMLGVVGEQR